MQIADFVYAGADKPSHRVRAAWLIGAWLGIVLLMTVQHVYWRDEVRALSLALTGDGVTGMWQALQGEGHPALWYLLLRAAHAVLPAPQVLAAVSVSVALGALLLLALRSPFALPTIALFVFGYAALYEYSVMARNYGISMLLTFALAAAYRHWRNHGIVLGLLMFALVNCNAHSVLLVGGFLLFWMLDLWRDRSLPRAAAARVFGLNALIAAAGIVACIVTIYPPFNDAAQSHVAGLSASALARALLLPATSFDVLLGPLSHHLPAPPWLLAPLLSALLFGATLGLVRHPPALWASLVTLVAMSCFFTFIYPGSYRHQALWLVFLLAMYWICAPGAARAPAPGPRLQRVQGAGLVLLCALLALQFANGIRKVPAVVLGAPESRSRDFARELSRHPGLHQATVVADPDFLVEALPFYRPNPTYLVREQRYGNVVRFTHQARLQLTVGDLLAEARRLRSSTGQPVVLLVRERLDLASGERTVAEGYNWQLRLTPADTAAFLSATRHLARFDPPCCTDEHFDAYVLD